MTLAPKPYLRSIRLKDTAKLGSSEYPYDIPAVRNLDVLTFHPDVTFFVGENGSGKSTVMEAVATALGFSPEGGTRNFAVSTTDQTSTLSANLRLSRGAHRPKDGYFFRAESFFNVATYMDQVGYLDGYGGKSLHARSHGEAFTAVLTHKLRGHGLYLFDEPEAALSPSRQLVALRAIHKLVLQESQLVIATHSPILLAYPRARIIQFDDEGLREIEYEESENYAITRDFLGNHQRRLEQLLEDIEPE
jgi:predicted ATPase